MSMRLLPPGCIEDVRDCEHYLNHLYDVFKMGIEAGDMRIIKNEHGGLFIQEGDTWKKLEVEEGDNYKSLTIVNNKIVWHTKQHNLLDGNLHTDTENETPVHGDLVVANSTPKWERLPKGTSGKYLKMLNDNDPGWASGPSGASLTGTDLFAQEWVRVRANSAGTATIDSNDWRGRVVWGYIAYFLGTVADANLEDEWGHAGTGWFEEVVGAATVGFISGISWAHNTAYTKGDKLKDDDLITGWICLVNHTSAAAGTFAADRAANPAYWTTFGAVVLGQGYKGEQHSRLYIDCGDSGKLKYLADEVYADEYQARFWVKASKSESLNTKTI